MKINCEHCRKEIKKKHHNQKYCDEKCRKAEERIRREKKNQEYMLKYNKDYYSKNKEEIEEKHKCYTKKRRKKDEEFRLKELVRAETKRNFKRDECSECGTKKLLEFHHTTYRTPVRKEDFIVLCKKHHRESHSQITTNHK